tara:strand:- start:1919 stop:2101 length:183 start_codon:yes stop_codon:yes gene_type:complete
MKNKANFKSDLIFPIFKEIYHRMVAARKPKKVAIIACIRKLVVIISSMVRDGVMWDPKMV